MSTATSRETPGSLIVTPVDGIVPEVQAVEAAAELIRDQYDDVFRRLAE